MARAKAKPALELVAIDDNGKQRKVQLNARVIEAPITKAEASDPDIAASKAIEDTFNQLSQSEMLVAPPYNLKKLAALSDISTELGQVIDALVTNIVGFGWRLRERRVSEGQRQKYERDIASEQEDLQVRLTTVHPIKSITQIMEEVVGDMHRTGNGYLELVENRQAQVVALNHVHGHSVRLSKLDPRPTKVMVPRIRPDRGYMIEQVPMYYRFRRFAQIQNNRLVWFKEAGDPRQLNVKTGEYADKLPLSKRATSLVHFKIYHQLTPYGVPKSIGNTFSIFGSRSAEETNFNTMENAIPSMFVIVENGVLTTESIERLKEWTENQVTKTKNRTSFILIEGDTADEGAPVPGQFKIKIEPLKQLQQQDQLYQEYDKNNRDKIRQAFRLPPLFVGISEEYNRATADASRDVADEQVFAPARSKIDHLLNRFVLVPWGSRFHMFEHNNPNITDDTELIRLMAIAEKSGAMTPRRADRIIRDVFGDNIGPLPTGIDLDKPFSITFAESQQGMGGEQQQKKMLGELIDLRDKIEKELESRIVDLGF